MNRCVKKVKKRTVHLVIWRRKGEPWQHHNRTSPHPKRKRCFRGESSRQASISRCFSSPEDFNSGFSVEILCKGSVPCTESWDMSETPFLYHSLLRESNIDPSVDEDIKYILKGETEPTSFLRPSLSLSLPSTKIDTSKRKCKYFDWPSFWV